MFHSLVSPRLSADFSLKLLCEFCFCLAASLVLWRELSLSHAVLLFAGLYGLRAVNWLIQSVSSGCAFWVTRQQRIDVMVETMRRLGMPPYTDSFSYDEAPLMVAGISQRADICDDLRAFLQGVAGELQYMRSNRMGLSYVQSLSILNGALRAHQLQQAMSLEPEADRVEERRIARDWKAA